MPAALNTLRAGQCCAPTAQNGPPNGRFNALYLLLGAKQSACSLVSRSIAGPHGPRPTEALINTGAIPATAPRLVQVSSFGLALWPLFFLALMVLTRALPR
ncbi:hypothetical protein PSV08DRAFT_284057 [Bipolaris maydis]|uniref:uncharacterized protein n=1 Tax=Cochliobolus heterostrophus TaxID=5016 RepID=UPI0024D47EEF|nr:hypothetical protein J3E73DRAFT_292916 [Bipolaris maydis]KAJ6273023.1 hypothetical protein PSV08DRAFT_284057 [Bipolaris maydis]KAJ6284120.1 hypothetical protein J3E71DRAFT_276282 [Bipolaris maydis]